VLTKTTLVWRRGFFGAVKVPENVSLDHADALAYIAWKGGVYEDCFRGPFRRWFRHFAAKHPDLATVKVFDVYPVDAFRWIGPYADTLEKECEPPVGDGR
jgi:hypothetical protein